MATVEQARAAQAQLRELVAGIPEVNGVGVARSDSGWVLRVNLGSRLRRGHKVPDRIGPVPVTQQVVGPLSAHAG
jgi:hypothetical protein